MGGPRMRLVALVVTLVLAPLAPPGAAAETSDDGAAAVLALRARVLAHDARAPDPLAALDAALAASREDPEPVRAAFRAALGPAGDARARVVVAEARLLGLAAANARAAEDPAEAAAWLRLALARVPWEARALPAGRVLDDPANATRADVAETLDAALALRAREEVVFAFLLRQAGRMDESRAHAEGAAALAGLLVPEASARLPPGIREAFEGNVTGVPALVATDAPRTGHALAPLLGGLAALEYGRDVERLDELAVRNVDAAFAAARAAAEDPDLADVALVEARRQYAADRAALFVAGEGTLEDVDAAYARLAAASHPDAVADAAGAVHAALRPVGLLERGIVLKVETGGVQAGREHLYKVTLVRPPLDGVAAFEVAIAYDPDVVRVLGVRPLVPLDASDVALEPGLVTFRGEGDVRRSAHLAHLVLEAAGPPNATTPLRVASATFTEPDGDRAAVLRLRDGEATVAYLERAPEALPEPPEARATPAPPALGALAAAALLAARARRTR